MATGWERYRKVQTLGQGAYGVVHLARDVTVDADDDDSHVAIKCVPLQDVSDRDKQMAMGEVAILRQLDHKNILRLLDCFIDEDSFLCSVTEFVDGGDLADFLRKAVDPDAEEEPTATQIDALVVADLAEQIFDGLAYLHANHVLHRDVKPQNFYITKSGVLKIGDFGVSKLLTASMPQAATFIGTPFYMAPEVCLGERYSFAADVWSVGVVLYELYIGKLPFRASNVLALVHKVTEGEYDGALLDVRPYSAAGAAGGGTSLGDELQRDICRLVAALVKRCLVVDPFSRPSSADLLSEFFRKDAPAGMAWGADGLELQSEIDWTEGAEAAGDGDDGALKSREPSWLVDSARLSQMAAVEPSARARRASADTSSPQRMRQPTEASALSAFGSSSAAAALGSEGSALNLESQRPVAPARPGTASHLDPQELERRIREKAMLLHRKRLAREKERRERDAADKVARETAAAEAQHEADVRRSTPPPLGRIGQPIDTRPHEQPRPAPPQASTPSKSDAHKELSPLELARSSQDLHASVKRIAAAIVAADPVRQACARTVLGSAAANVLDDDDDDAELPLRMNLLAGDRIVALKGKRGMSYKKLLKKVRKGLGLDGDDDVPGDLTYRDSDGDEVLIGGKREWRHAVEDFVERGADVFVLRLHSPDDDG